MADAKVTARVMTPPFRMSYPTLITPKQFVRNGKPQGDPKFSVNMIFNMDQDEKFRHFPESGDPVLVSIKKLGQELAAKKWPGKKMGELFPPKQSNGIPKGWLIINGDKKAAEMEAKGKDAEAYKGKFVIAATSTESVPPELRYLDGKKQITLDRTNEKDMAKAKELFVGGYYCATAVLNLMAHTVDDNNFITAYVNNLLFWKKGEKIGKGSLMDRFEGIEGGEADFDPTAGLDDEFMS